jgi:hypothetical protein
MERANVEKVADWEKTLDTVVGFTSGTLSLSDIEIASLDGNQATGTIHAKIAFSNGQGSTFTNDYSGPFTAIKESDGWKLVDYQRNGRSVTQEVRAEARGHASKDGIIAQVKGVDLKNNGTWIVVSVSNRTNHPLATNYIASFVYAGQQHDQGSFTVDTVAPHATALGVYYWDAAIPAKAKTIRLITKSVIDNPNPLQIQFFNFDIPIRLGS